MKSLFEPQNVKKAEQKRTSIIAKLDEAVRKFKNKLLQKNKTQRRLLKR